MEPNRPKVKYFQYLNVIWTAVILSSFEGFLNAAEFSSCLHIDEYSTHSTQLNDTLPAPVTTINFPRRVVCMKFIFRTDGSSSGFIQARNKYLLTMCQGWHERKEHWTYTERRVKISMSAFWCQHFLFLFETCTSWYQLNGKWFRFFRNLLWNCVQYIDWWRHTLRRSIIANSSATRKKETEKKKRYTAAQYHIERI